MDTCDRPRGPLRRLLDRLRPAPATVGTVRLHLDGDGWRVEGDLRGRHLAVALFPYLERLFVATGGHHARLLCEALEKAVTELNRFEAEEMAAARFLRQTLLRDWLGELIEEREEAWTVESTLVRRPEPALPGGRWYGETTRFHPEVLDTPELRRIATTSLVVWYEAAFDLDDLDRSHLLLHTLHNLLRYTAAHGMPREPGRGATIAMLQHFGLEERPEREVAAAMRDFLAG